MKTAEDIIKEKNRSIITVSPEVTIIEALKIMAQHNIGAILIKENDQITGIYTERDLLKNTVEKGFDPRTALIKDYMTTNLICASSDETLHKLQDKMLGKRLRHIVVTKEGKVIGMISAGDVTRTDLLEHHKQLKSVSWDYYENWGWKKK